MAQSEVIPASEPVAPNTRPTQRIGAWLAEAATREPAATWLLTRALFLLLTYFGVILFNSVLHGPHPSFLHQLLPSWNRWDTQWYEGIARRGYDWRKAVGTSPTAFFPLYPLLIRVSVEATHRSYLMVALLISNLAFLGALLYLWRLTAFELGRAAAGRGVLYISIFPTALFFFAGYTESLFLLLTVGCFYHLRRHQWLLAGLLAALASATRVTGILLVLPLAYEYGDSIGFSWRRLNRGVAGVVIAPLGLLAFMLYLKLTVGDALAFSHYQAAWQKIATFRLWAGLLESARQIIVLQPRASFYQAHNVLNLGIGLLFLVWSVFAARKLPLAYALYLAAFWVVTLSNPAMAGGYPVPLVSLSRYVLSLFPVFMYMAALGARRGFHDAYMVLSVGLLALLTVQFINGGWVV